MQRRNLSARAIFKEVSSNRPYDAARGVEIKVQIERYPYCAQNLSSHFNKDKQRLSESCP
jgi:hypothetical protein